MNTSNKQSFPTWYILNDSCIVLFNLLTILIGMTFICLVVRRKKLRTIINILSCNSCLCGSWFALMILWDAYHMLKTDLSGLVQQDSTCVLRNICTLIAMITLNYSLCIQTYHRFIMIVYSQHSFLRSMKVYIKIIVIQWVLPPLLIIPIIRSEEIIYQSGSFLCQIPLSNRTLFTYLFIVSYGIPIFFILILHLCIARFIQKHWKFRRQRRRTRAYIICPLQRILLIILVLLISYLPYGIFFILEHLRVTIVPYAQKLGMIFASLSFSLTMLIIFLLNHSIRNAFVNLFRRTERLRIEKQ